MTHFHVFRCGAYVFLLEEVHTNKLNPKSELMTFIGYPQGTKGWMFMRGPNNVTFIAAQALFDETLFLKCPDMCQPGYTPVADPPVDQQGEYNIPPDDENEDYGSDGGNMPPLPPVPYVYPNVPQGPSPPHSPGVTLPGSLGSCHRLQLVHGLLQHLCQ